VIQKFEQVAPSPEKLVEITSKRKPQQPEPQSSADTNISTAQKLATEVLISPGVRPKAVEKLAREVLGTEQKPTPAATRMNGKTYSRELNHWKGTTKNFLRGVGLALGSRKESETRECLVRYVKRLRTTTKKSSLKVVKNAVAHMRARASRGD
jgi:hypothetical protein